MNTPLTQQILPSNAAGHAAGHATFRPNSAYSEAHSPCWICTTRDDYPIAGIGVPWSFDPDRSTSRTRHARVSPGPAQLPLAGHPGAEDGAHAGLGPVDLSVRVPAKIFLHLPLQGFDLLVQGGDHRDERPGGGSVGGGEGRRLAQLLAAQRRQDRRRLVRDIPAVSALERGADLRAGQPRGPVRVRGLAQQMPWGRMGRPGRAVVPRR